jgi:hypothetical protein
LDSDDSSASVLEGFDGPVLRECHWPEPGTDPLHGLVVERVDADRVSTDDAPKLAVHVDHH